MENQQEKLPLMAVEKRYLTRIYETTEMTPDEIAAANTAYKAMGLDCVVIDISRFSARVEIQPDGTYQTTTIRRPRRSGDAPADGTPAKDAPDNESGTDTGQPES